MNRHFRREVEELSRSVLRMGGLAETALGGALRAYRDHDEELAERVIEGDAEVNGTELRIEEEVLKLLALYQPAARDLRYLVGVFKITNDLERVGDLAVNIAERARDRTSAEQRPGARDLEEMGARVRAMLSQALDAFVAHDADKAGAVLALDDAVDELLGKLYGEQRDVVAQGRTTPDAALRLLSTAKYLERIADLATNIAEDVIYMATGEIVRHGGAIHEPFNAS